MRFFEFERLRLEVVDMNGNQVDKVLVLQIPESTSLPTNQP